MTTTRSDLTQTYSIIREKMDAIQTLHSIPVKTIRKEHYGEYKSAVPRRKFDSNYYTTMEIGLKGENGSCHVQLADVHPQPVYVLRQCELAEDLSINTSCSVNAVAYYRYELHGYRRHDHGGFHNLRHCFQLSSRTCKLRMVSNRPRPR